jgi:hypothetical protein
MSTDGGSVITMLQKQLPFFKQIKRRDTPTEFSYEQVKI